ncbi:unnamed protein product [Rhizoctonia solani]|uniref:NACHT domain-containing protein n=1 Tax=Rhizoctonia solani TaxID=456999 RepID=A0A8H3I284_9AGAM|nr:unnamed protein product [Rhizoctonia solani]
MSRSTKGSKPKRFYFNLLDKLRISRSPSPTPSQLSLQPSHGASSSHTKIDETAGKKSLGGSVRFSADTPVAGYQEPNPSGSGGDTMRVRMNIVPPDNNGTTEQSSDHEEPAPQDDGPSEDTPDDDPELLRQNVLWAGLRTSLEMLKDAPDMLPDFIPSVEMLISCLEGLKSIGRSRTDYEDLTKELTTLSESLRQNEGGLLSIPMSDALLNMIVSIYGEACAIKENLESGNIDGEEIIRHYRRINSTLRMLETNARMSAKNISEDSVNTRLDRLSPVREATYDSSLPPVNRQICTTGTRVAVFTGLDEWLSDPASPSVYWINGMAGIGKTAIAYTFGKRMRIRKLLGASFFCNRESTECRDVSRIIPTIAYQLARYSAPFRLALYDALGHHPEAASRVLQKQFEVLLLEPLQKVKGALPDQVVIIIDALDECINHRGVEELLDLLFQHASHIPLKFLITSRPETGIYAKMSSHAKSRAGIQLQDIEKALVQADIKLYLTQELEFLSPTEADIDQLVDRAGMSFAHAARLVRFAHSDKHQAPPHERLRSLLDQQPRIDDMYMKVVGDALTDDELEEDEIEDIRMLLYTVLLEEEPINLETIAMLGGIGTVRRVENALYPLRDVLHHSETTGLVSSLDSTFPEIMFSKERSEGYYCDVPEHSQRLAQGCFLGMKERLRFNICKLETSFLPDNKVEDLQSRIKEEISAPLAYACRYWANHLDLVAQIDSALMMMLSEFLSTQLFCWMEVLNLRNELNVGIAALLKAKRRLEGISPPPRPELVALLNDAYTFMQHFAASEVSHSTPHIYISSLQLCPRSSLVYKIYSSSVKKMLKSHESVTESRDVPTLEHQSWDIGSGVLSIACSPDGTRFAVGCENGTISIRNSRDGSPLSDSLSGHTNWVRCVVFSPDGTRILSSSSDSTIRVWDALDGKPVSAPFEGHSHPVRAVAYSSDGSRIVSGSWDNTVRLWDSADGHPILQPLEGHKWGVNCVTFQPGSALVASGGNDHTIRLWDLANDTLNTTKVLSGHTNSVTSVSFTPDGERLVSGSADSTICIWNVSDGTPMSRFLQDCNHIVYSVATSPSGPYVASGSADSTIRVWNIDTGKLVAGPIVGHSHGVRAVAFSPDGARILSSSHDGVVRSWDITTKSPKTQMRGVLGQGNYRKPHDRQPQTGELDKQATLLFHSHVSTTTTPFSWLLDGSDQAYLHEKSLGTKISFDSGSGVQLPDGWLWQSDGWLVNGSAELVVWVPTISNSCHLSDHAAHNSKLLSLLSRDDQFIGKRWPVRNTPSSREVVGEPGTKQ